MKKISRIATNYLRLIIGFAVGIIVVRQLIGFGADVFNIYTLVTIGAGVGVMLRELMRITLVPDLSKAWAGRAEPGGAAQFRAVYANAFAYSCAVAVLGGVLFAMLGYALPYFDLRTENINAARWFVASRGLLMVVGVALSPLYTMQFVLQRFAQANAAMTFERLCDLIAVFAPLIVIVSPNLQANALLVFAAASAALAIGVLLVNAVVVLRVAPAELAIAIKADRRLARGMAHSLFWSLLIVLSFNLYIRFDTMVANIYLGSGATIALGIAVQLIGMVRQATNGIVTGLDAVAAGLSHARPNTANAGDGVAQSAKHGRSISAPPASVLHLVNGSTYVQTLVSASLLVLLQVWLPYLVDFWVGRHLASDAITDQAVTVARIMLWGIFAISISDGWTNIMNGLGSKRLYVPQMSLLAACNVVALLTIAYAGKVTLPAVAILFSSLLIFGNLAIVPWVCARFLHINVFSLARPVLRGLLPPGLAFLAMILFDFAFPHFDVLVAMAASGLLIGLAASVSFIVEWRLGTFNPTT